MRLTADRLKAFKEKAKTLEKRARQHANRKTDENIGRRVKEIFAARMDDDLDVKGAFDGIYDLLLSMDTKSLAPSVASGCLKALEEIDQVLQVLFRENGAL